MVADVESKRKNIQSSEVFSDGYSMYFKVKHISCVMYVMVSIDLIKSCLNMRKRIPV